MERILVEVNDVLREMTKKELDKLTKNLFSISRHGYWEDKNTTVLLVEVDGVLNLHMRGFWCVRTDERLIKYHGYTRKELRGE